MQLTATIMPTNASNKAVTWSSSNVNVATVSETGLVSAAGYGTAKITVTTQGGEHTATCEVRVVYPKNITYDITDVNFREEVYAAIGKTAPAIIWDIDVAKITTLTIRCKYIQNLAGIQHFTGLQYLDCSNNHLTELDVSGLTNLQWLRCDRDIDAHFICDPTLITSLNVSGCTNLQWLDCRSNQLTSLNVSGLTNLQSLWCGDNQLTSLDVSGLTNLQSLYCANNQLTSLNVSGLTNLQLLAYTNNQLTSLDVSGLTNLQSLGCGGNQVTSLDVSGLTNLQSLGCDNNQLTELDVSGLTNLQGLWCANNQLTELDVSGLTNMQTLSCANNQLTELNVWGTNLQWLYCENNQLTELNVSGLTNMLWLECENNQLTELDVSGCASLQTLYCKNNQLTALSVLRLTNLQTLYCENNQLTELDVWETNLNMLDCRYNNMITTADVSGWDSWVDYEVDYGGRFNPQNTPTSGVTLNKSATTIDAAYTEQLTATVTPSTASNQTVRWSSSNTAVATVDVQGNVSGISAGIATITATTYVGSHTATCEITVIYQPATGVTLSKSATSIAVGASEQLNATFEPNNASNKAVKWSSDNASVATVNAGGLVKAVSTGTATITVTTKDGGHTAACAVTVVQPVTGVTINKNSTTINVNDTEQLTATVAPANASNRTVIWNSSNTTVATVHNGFVKAVSVGTAYITATTQDGDYSVTCTVRVNPVDITSAFIDDNFRNAVYTVIGKTAPAPIMNNDVSHITSLDVYNSGIASLAGIEYFSGLQSLYCTNNQLTSLNVSGLTNLQWLDCRYNQLTSLDVSGLTNLQTLYCTNNQLPSLNVSGLTNLQWLDCSYNQLISLDVSEGMLSLSYLDCRYNNMISTDDVIGWDESLYWSFYPQNTVVTGVSLSTTSATIVQGATVQLIATVLPDEATNQTVTWSSSTPSVALVDSNGKVTAVSAGTATITVTTHDGGYTATCTVTVNPEMDITSAFTDNNFRNAVYAVIGKTAPAPILNTDVIRITSLHVNNSNIASLAGIEYFSGLQWLNCGTNKLTSLDISGLTNLTDLVCNDNQLTSLDVSGLTNLQWLYGNDNQLTSLNVSGLTNLQELNCEGNQLTSLDLSGLTNLQGLSCSNNQLTSLDLSGLTNLQGLYCSNNQLTSLDVSGLTNLQWLSCYNNQLTSLDVSECMLDHFDCRYNNMRSTADVIGWKTSHNWYFDPQNTVVSGVSLNKTSATITQGATEQLTATVLPDEASNKTVTWSSSNTAVASVSNNGLVTAVSTGTATITVTTQVGGKTASCTVTVSARPQPVTGVSLNKTATTINAGATEQLTATVAPDNATNKTVTWSSSNTAVATVNASGLVTAVSAGTTNIRVSTEDGNKTATCAVTVLQPATGVSLNKSATTIVIGSTEQLSATVAPANASNKTVSWSSSNTAVASVNNTGSVTAVSIGTATITVSTDDGNKTATCAVTVNDLPITFTALALDGGVKVALYRNVRLTCTFSGGVPTHFRTAESETEVNSAAWQSYNAASLFHTFASEAHGYKTVYAQLKNTVGETTVQNAVIIYKPEHPKQEVRGFAINAGAWATESRTVTLTHSVINAVPTLYSASENPLLVGKEWLPYKALPQFTLSNGAGLKEVYFAVANAADTSAMVSAQIWLDEPVTKADNETEASSALSVKLYPNPVKTAATVEVDGGKGKVQISVYDVSCRMYLSRTFDAQTFSLDLTDCPSGILLVRIVNNGNSVIKKVIKN